MSTRPAREALASYLMAAAVVMLVIGAVLSVADLGATPAVAGVVLLVASQFLHPFWKPKWKPDPPPPERTLADFGIDGLKQGERWQAREDAAVDVAVHWAPMGNFSHADSVPAGTLVIVEYPHAPDATFVALNPADSGALEARLVREELRTSSKYQGYSLTVKPAEFAGKFVRF
jgi:hypothetical protein